MAKLEKIKLKNFQIHLYSSLDGGGEPSLFLVHDGDIFLKMKDRILGRLDQTWGKIIIAFVHSNNRFDEYTPWPEEVFRKNYPFTGGGDGYLSFLKDDLKTYIEGYLALKIDRRNTYLAGASLGGLISLYGLLEYGSSFGGAICISSSFWYDNFLDYLEKITSPRSDQKIYLDVGDREGKGDITLHRDVLSKTQEAYDILINRGFREDQILFKIQPGMSHRSDYFVDRLYDGMEFLHKKSPGS